MRSKVLCSTGAFVGRVNGRNYKLIIEYAKKIQQELKRPKPQYTNNQNIDIVPYILKKYDLTADGARNSTLNKALFRAQKMGATSSEIEEIASHSTLPDSEKSYMIRRYTKWKF